ncbi:hypothetical protein GWI33_020161 [Rhynchophorus ferrugineus]|uniref:Uncharacterized protein n=1 Tax=Rhynchophorus ferrugineus TaxID=354439 RepID=A0A834M3N0_RHYFE|nr:hypothetical protein GWI33_020161 [Rhynchophorus ferrugineus]
MEMEIESFSIAAEDGRFSPVVVRVQTQKTEGGIGETDLTIIERRIATNRNELTDDRKLRRFTFIGDSSTATEKKIERALIRIFSVGTASSSSPRPIHPPPRHSARSFAVLFNYQPRRKPVLHPRNIHFESQHGNGAAAGGPSHRPRPRPDTVSPIVTGREKGPLAVPLCPPRRRLRN